MVAHSSSVSAALRAVDVYKRQVLYYSDQCPHTAKYVPIACEVAAKYGFPLEAVHFGTYAQAQQAPCPLTTYAFFDHGAFVTNEILSPAKLEKYMQARRAAEA